MWNKKRRGRNKETRDDIGDGIEQVDEMKIIQTL